MIDRFDLYMKHKKLNDNQVSIQLGLSNGVIGKSRNPGRDISRRVLEQIEKYYADLNMDWLVSGTGEMLKPIQETNPPDGVFVPGTLLKQLQEQSETIKCQQETIRLLTEMASRLTGGNSPQKEMAG